MNLHVMELELGFDDRARRYNSPFNYTWHRMMKHLMRSDIDGKDWVAIVILRNRLKGEV